MMPHLYGYFMAEIEPRMFTQIALNWNQGFKGILENEIAYKIA